MSQNLPQFRASFPTVGANKDREEKTILSKEGCDILVATPGQSTTTCPPRVGNAFRHLDTLDLDESNALLDMDFVAGVKNIVKCVPDKEATGRNSRGGRMSGKKRCRSFQP